MIGRGLSKPCTSDCSVPTFLLRDYILLGRDRTASRYDTAEAHINYLLPHCSLAANDKRSIKQAQLYLKAHTLPVKNPHILFLYINERPGPISPLQEYPMTYMRSCVKAFMAEEMIWLC